MNQILTIENEYLKVGVSRLGGSLDSVYSKTTGEELLWQGEESSWTGKDIVIFPFVARLKDGFYTIDGQEFRMEIHGLIRKTVLNVAEHTHISVTMEMVSDTETLKKYPFPFVFHVIYRLEGNRLVTAYRIQNTGTHTMYFGVGGHPGYQIDGEEKDGKTDTSGNLIVFDKPVNLRKYTGDETNFFITGTADYAYTDKLDLGKQLFVDDALILQNPKVDFELRRKSGTVIRFENVHSPVLAFWSKKDSGAYVCIEPWWGLPDSNPPIREMSCKLLINALDAGKEFFASYDTLIK